MLLLTASRLSVLLSLSFFYVIYFFLCYAQLVQGDVAMAEYDSDTRYTHSFSYAVGGRLMYSVTAFLFFFHMHGWWTHGTLQCLYFFNFLSHVQLVD